MTRHRPVAPTVTPEQAFTAIVTVNGQVTLPKKVLEAAGIKPGDQVEVRAIAPGRIIIEKSNAFS